MFYSVWHRHKDRLPPHVWTSQVTPGQLPRRPLPSSREVPAIFHNKSMWFRCTYCFCWLWVWTAASEWTAGLRSSPLAAGPAPSPCSHLLHLHLLVFEPALFKIPLPPQSLMLSAGDMETCLRWDSLHTSCLDSRHNVLNKSSVWYYFLWVCRDGKTVLNFLRRLFSLYFWGRDVISRVSQGLEAGGAAVDETEGSNVVTTEKKRENQITSSIRVQTENHSSSWKRRREKKRLTQTTRTPQSSSNNFP